MSMSQGSRPRLPLLDHGSDYPTDPAPDPLPGWELVHTLTEVPSEADSHAAQDRDHESDSDSTTDPIPLKQPLGWWKAYVPRRENLIVVFWILVLVFFFVAVAIAEGKTVHNNDLLAAIEANGRELSAAIETNRRELLAVIQDMDARLTGEGILNDRRENSQNGLGNYRSALGNGGQAFRGTNVAKAPSGRVVWRWYRSAVHPMNHREIKFRLVVQYPSDPEPVA
ncbi:hypothetical protein B0H11DRAFT_1941047 [Mycena galericulata]|nr:hypothetical protein B0H11DRAFT_1941047 [Mycena galericulata]